jgi:hypothetical protein
VRGSLSRGFWQVRVSSRLRIASHNRPTPQNRGDIVAVDFGDGTAKMLVTNSPSSQSIVLTIRFEVRMRSQWLSDYSVSSPAAGGRSAIGGRFPRDLCRLLVRAPICPTLNDISFLPV